MGEVAQADFRTDAEQEECGGVLPRVEVARVAFLLVKKRLRETWKCKWRSPWPTYRATRGSKLPEHPMAEAANYTLSQWEELTVFTSDGSDGR